MLITEELYIKHVGKKPVDDDLERCNCPNAGKVGHNSCGWNEPKQKPVFMVGINSE